jgi:shikimate kinase
VGRPWWLLGLMGCGKSTLGRAAAELTGRRYVDNDATIAELAGRSTATLSRAAGSVLHEWEAAYVRELAVDPEPVIAGIPASCADRPEDLELLSSTGLLVYLRCRPETLAARVLAGPPRPWLVGSAEETQTLLADMFAARDPAMRAHAEVTLDGEQALEDLVAQLLSAGDGAPARS